MQPPTSRMDPRKLSTQELVSYCVDSQDEAGWNEFAGRFQPHIARVVNRCVCRRVGPNPALVDDLVQDTYLKLCANNYKPLRDFNFKDDHGFFGFLKVVASRVVEDHFRGSHSQKRGSGREQEDIEEVRTAAPFRSTASQPAELAILMGEIERCLAELVSEPNFARDHAIFWLYYRQGLTAKAIAQLPANRLSVKGVESTLLRLTRFVKARLTDPPPPRRKASGG
jgi:RNA polymerase sigma-70 factor (ECF subfamily)